MWSMDKMASKFDVLDEADEFGVDPAMPVYGDLTIEQRVQVARHAKAMIAWIQEVHRGVLQDALAGEPTPGMKAIAGRRGKRAWTDESAAVEAMEAAIGDHAYSRKPISPAQAEKLLPKEAWKSMSSLISQPPGKPALVDESNPAPALKGYVDKFDDLTTETE
jgi:plasmid stability protein